MNCYKDLLRSLKITFLLFTLQLIAINSLAQSNSIKITPLNFLVYNTDLGYERMFKNKTSLGGNLQFWFQDKERYSNFVGKSYSRNINKGLRGSIVLRKYFRKRGNETKGSDFNCGLSIHFGQHYVKKISSFIPLSFNLSGIWGPTSTSNSQPSHNYTPTYDTSILSGGIGFHFAYRLLFKDGFFMNFELITRGSLANKKGNQFPNVIKGRSFQPRFQVGYRF